MGNDKLYYISGESKEPLIEKDLLDWSAGNYATLKVVPGGYLGQEPNLYWNIAAVETNSTGGDKILNEVAKRLIWGTIIRVDTTFPSFSVIGIDKEKTVTTRADGMIDVPWTPEDGMFPGLFWGSK